MRWILATTLALAACASTPTDAVRARDDSRPRAAEPVTWAPWSPDAFARAAREERLVLLYVEAQWCHW